MIHRLPLKFVHIYAAVSVGIFLVVQILKHSSFRYPNWVFHHLNDFLVIPIVSTVCLHGVWFVKRDNTLRLGIFTILSLVTLYAVFFEYYLPQQSHRYTSDIWDVASYFAGGMVFYFLQKTD